MNSLVKTIAFHTFGPLDPVHTSYIAPFPTVFILQYTRFMFALQIMVIKLPTLNLLLIRLLAFALLCTFHMSIQMMNISDLGETLITHGLEAKTILLKMWLLFRIFSTSSAESQELDCSLRYGMPTILR